MKTLKKVFVTYRFVEYIPSKEEMKEGEIYISKKYETSVHKCLCGCGNLTVTPLNKNEWSYSEKNEKLTMVPSIGNFSFLCKSHYIITNGIANFV